VQIDIEIGIYWPVLEVLTMLGTSNSGEGCCGGKTLICLPSTNIGLLTSLYQCNHCADIVDTDFTSCCRKCFSRGRHVISDNRSSLLPDRAEQLILCAARFAIKQSHGTLTVPTIVDIGVPFSDAEVIARDDLVDRG
jgi:hypothetical protein